MCIRDHAYQVCHEDCITGHQPKSLASSLYRLDVRRTRQDKLRRDNVTGTPSVSSYGAYIKGRDPRNASLGVDDPTYNIPVMFVRNQRQIRFILFGTDPERAVGIERFGGRRNENSSSRYNYESQESDYVALKERGLVERKKMGWIKLFSIRELNISHAYIEPVKVRSIFISSRVTYILYYKLI